MIMHTTEASTLISQARAWEYTATFARSLPGTKTRVLVYDRPGTKFEVVIYNAAQDSALSWASFDDRGDALDCILDLVDSYKN